MRIKLSKLFIAVLALILTACLYGVNGQYSMPSNEAQSATQSIGQYSQYYTMDKGTAAAHVGAPQQLETAGNTPTTVYFGNQMQAVPFSRYQSSSAYSSNSSLWIKGATDWSQYATVPIGANVTLLAISPIEGVGALNLADSDGKTYSYNYFFYNNSELTFYADSPGRHTIYFVVGRALSNPVVIDVTGTVTMTYNPTSNYYPPTSNYYPPISNYPGYYEPYSYFGPQAALDLADANKAYQKMYGNYYNGDWYYGTYSWLNSP